MAISFPENLDEGIVRMWNEDEHPDRQTLEAFVSGRLEDDKQQLAVETHIECCDECARLLDQVSIEHSFFNADASPPRERESRAEQIVSGKDRVQPLLVDSPSQSLIGSWLGKYRISEIVGHGGMGTVYRAEDTILNRNVAVKVLRQDQDTVDANSVMTRLVEEAQSAGAIAHPNVVTIYDFVADSGVDFLAMEYLAGGSVADLITQSSALDLQESIRLVSGACQGIDAAHRRGILHRDIKPANLLLTRDQQVKVGDFGLAMQSARHKTLPTGAIAGTVHFMSPEQCRDESLDQRSDIYSLGATLFTLMTGQPPYQDFDSAEQITFAHCHAPVPDPQQFDSKIPVAHARIAMRAMAKNPDDRYASCGELLDELSSLSSISQSRSSARRWRQFAKLPTGPTVVVMPPECLTDEPDDALLAGGIACEINSQLSQFRNLRVVAHRTAAQNATRQLAGDELRRELSADYVVGGTIQRVGRRLRLTVALSSTDTAATLWSQRFDRTMTDENLFEIQDEIAENVSSKLAQPYGELHRAERTRVGDDNDDLDGYGSVLRFYDYWHRESIDDYWPVRNALADAVERFPDYATAHAALALMLANAVRVHRLPEHDDALQRAAEHARRALRLDPRSEMAHQALVTSLYHLGDMQQFDAAAEKALLAYPNHSDLLADIGLFLAVSGNQRRGVPLAQKAIALSPDPPGWYFSALVCDAFLAGDFHGALECARRIGGENVWGPFHLAISLSHLGRMDEAAKQLKAAESFVPDLASQVDSMISFFHPCDELRTVFWEGLKRAGLKGI